MAASPSPEHSDPRMLLKEPPSPADIPTDRAEDGRPGNGPSPCHQSERDVLREGVTGQIRARDAGNPLIGHLEQNLDPRYPSSQLAHLLA